MFRLKIAKEDDLRRVMGNEFQIDGPWKEKALSPMVFRAACGVQRRSASFERNDLAGEYGTKSCFMYKGMSGLLMHW